MKYITFSWLLLLINDILANPVTQKYADRNRSSHLRPRKIDVSTQPQTYIEDFPDYPKNYIRSLNLQRYEHLFGDDFVDTLDLRFDADEVGLCSSRKRLIYPKRGITPQGTWLTIVNNDDDKYKQGILVEECVNESNPCDYSQNFPLSVMSKCKQSFTYRSLLAVNTNGNLVTEHFQFPSCCKCFVTNGHRSGNVNRFGSEFDAKVARGVIDDRPIWN